MKLDLRVDLDLHMKKFGDTSAFTLSPGASKTYLPLPLSEIVPLVSFWWAYTRQGSTGNH